jgi:hypothetical protein
VLVVDVVEDGAAHKAVGLGGPVRQAEARHRPVHGKAKPLDDAGVPSDERRHEHREAALRALFGDIRTPSEKRRYAATSTRSRPLVCVAKSALPYRFVCGYARAEKHNEGRVVSGFARAMSMAILWMAVLPTHAIAALAPVKVARGVQSAYALRADVRSGRTPVLRTLQIAGTGAGVIKWRCSGPCHHAPGPATQITHPKGSTVIGRLNLALRGTNTIKIDVIVPSGQSRFLVLTATRKGLRVTSAGCIDARGRAGVCNALTPQPAAPSPNTQPPASAPIPQAFTPTPTPTPVPTASPTPTSTPTPTGPANNPDGRFLSVTRVDLYHAEVTGWANDADAPGAPITVRALVTDVPAAEAVTTTFLPQFGGRTFDFVVPVDTNRRTICVIAVNVGGGVDTMLNRCRDVPDVGDLNDDGYVGCADLGIIQSQFGQSGDHLTGDIDRNGIVTAHDLSLLLGKWSPPPTDPNPCPAS